MKLLLVLVFVAVAAAGHIRPNLVRPVKLIGRLNSKVAPIHAKSTAERIIGGNEVVPHSVPHQVGLFLANAYFCGGSLISTTWVLTAAHCGVLDDTPEVVLGAHRVDDATEATQVRLTGRSTVHETYDEFALTDDISVISIPTVTFNANIKSVALVDASASTFEGVTAYTTGWGKTSDNSLGKSPVLRNTSNIIISNTECGSYYGDVPSTQICLSSKGSGTCSGDSGGPLTVLQNGVHVEIGVTSYVSSAGCESGAPDGFTRVSAYRGWITQHTGV